MRRTGFDGAFWPSPLQEALLRVALMSDDAAREAWRRIRPDLDLDDLWDPEVHRILPLVHAALVRLGEDDPDLPRLKGLARRTWYDNQVRMRAVTPALVLLRDAGIPTMLLKGLPIALGYYRDLSLRPMRDIDVMVPTRRTVDARRVLAEHGWEVHRAAPALSHGEGVSHVDGAGFDLHWHLGMPFVLPDREADSEMDVWAAAEPLELPGVTTLMPCPADMLLHVCVHGAWSGSGSAMRWVTDASCVLRARGDGVEWERMLEQIERRRLVLHMAEPLRYLREVIGAPVPGSVVARVAAMPATRRERAYHRRVTHDVTPRSLVGGLPLTVAQWSYASAKWSRTRAARQLPLFLRDHWGLVSVAELPREAVGKGLRRLRGRGAAGVAQSG